MPHISQESCGCRKLLTPTLTILQGKQDACLTEKNLSDRLFASQNRLFDMWIEQFDAQSEKKRLLQKIDQLQLALRVDVRERQEVLTANCLLCNCMLHLIAGPWDHASRHMICIMTCTEPAGHVVGQ